VFLGFGHLLVNDGEGMKKSNFEVTIVQGRFMIAMGILDAS